MLSWKHRTEGSPETLNPTFFFAHLFDVRKSRRSNSRCHLRTPGPKGWAREGLRRAVRLRMAAAARQVGRQRRMALRGSKRALQSQAQEAPPAAQPTLPSRKAQGGTSALSSEAHELSDKAHRLSAPTASNFTGEDAQSLRPRP